MLIVEIRTLDDKPWRRAEFFPTHFEPLPWIQKEMAREFNCERDDVWLVEAPEGSVSGKDEITVRGKAVALYDLGSNNWSNDVSVPPL